MKLSFFQKRYKLSSEEVETLKVALLDAQKQCEYERSLLSDDDKQLLATVNKINRLVKLVEKLELKDVFVQDIAE